MAAEYEIVDEKLRYKNYIYIFYYPHERSTNFNVYTLCECFGSLKSFEALFKF